MSRMEVNELPRTEQRIVSQGENCFGDRDRDFTSASSG